MEKSPKEILSLSVLACLWALQAAVITQQLLSLWPVPWSFKETLLPEAALRMAPKWDLAIALVFVSVVLVAGNVLFCCHRGRLKGWLLAYEAALAFLMVSCLFKMLVYFDSPGLAHTFLLVLMAISIAGKIFYPEAEKSIEVLYHWITAARWRPHADAFWMLTIWLLIYMPDLQRVLALDFIGDWMHHFDFIVMSVGWAALNGQLPYVDVISQYGVGLPVIFARLTQASGGFDYPHVLQVMMWFVIIYFMCMYGLVRYWLKDALIAGVAFLLVFRLQMFHYGVSPLIWITMSASPVRFGLDVVWMAALLAFLRGRRPVSLVFAGLYSGFAVFYMTSVGLCTMVTFYAYLLALAALPYLRRTILADGRQKPWYLVAWILPIMSMALFFLTYLKGHVFQKEFWRNLSDYMVAFSWNGSIPMWESLKYRHFWAFFMSMVVPLTYLSTLLYVAACLYLKKSRPERLFLGLICMYGLANYQYYVVRAAITSYYVNALPFVLVACFWFVRCLEFMPLVWRRRLRAASVVLSFYALFTNQNYLTYPNLISVSRNPMTDKLVIQRFPDRSGFFNNQYKKVKEQDKLAVNDLGQRQEDLLTEDDFHNDGQLVDYFHRHFDFSKDAQMIDRLTKPGERVALLSSFETKILMQADRPPFFYHFPMLSSRPMTFRSFPADAAQTPAYFPDTFKNFQDRPPDYVFLEKVFLEKSLPPSYDEDKDKRLKRVMAIISYVKAHYRLLGQGQYLAAMKRI